MLSTPDALTAASALSLVEGRSRREWSLVFESLRLIDVTWQDLLRMQAIDAWKWLGWDAASYRAWQSALDIARARIGPAVEAGVAVVSGLDDDVPKWLLSLQAVPWVFYLGDISILDRKTLGFSGQREARDESLAITAELATEAARLGYAVVSGGARGIDIAAHTVALEAGGTTAVLLPQGLSTWRAPYALANPHHTDRVVALSEDVPWEGWSTESAMRRNRMIVEISNVFTVPQSGTSGGSHSTGMYALKRGKVTYVPDLGADYPGNQKLLQHGARALADGETGYDLEGMRIDSIPVKVPVQTSFASDLP